MEQGGDIDAERARLLEHGIHEENIFYTRLNFFLVFESVLLGSVIQTATATGTVFGYCKSSPSCWAFSFSASGRMRNFEN